MKIFLAGENGKKKIIPAVAGGTEFLLRYLKMRIYLAGGYREI